MSDESRGIDRRTLLAGTGLATAGAAGAALLKAAPAFAHATAMPAVNVKDHGAAGNGSTDDRAAIQSALDHVPAGGAMVFLPPGDYVVGGPLLPKSRTLIVGSGATSYDSSVNPDSLCKIRCASNFSGTGLIAPASGTYAITIRDLALVGNLVGANVHGIRLPDYAAARERALVLDGVTINGFSGNGIHGHLHVGVLNNCHIARNNGWGVNATGGNAWKDVFATNCYLYFNKAGNLYFGGSQASGLVEFANCRFERAGADPNNVGNPPNPLAPGVRLASAERIGFANCSTDANMGNGFEIIHEADTLDYYPRNIRFANCTFSRDGTGNQASQGNFAGLKVSGSGSTDALRVARVTCTNCHINYGKANDNGSGTVVGPKYGVWYEHSTYFHWIGGNVSVGSGNTPYNAGAGDNWRPAVYDPEHKYLTAPLAAPTAAIPNGTLWVDEGASQLNVRVGGVWKSVNLV